MTATTTLERPAPNPPPAKPARRVRRVVLRCLVIALLLVGQSYARALLAPGNASFSSRSVDWLRDHGAGGVIDRVENWWFTRSPPADTSPTPLLLPSPDGITGYTGAAPPPLPASVVRTPYAGEGRWVAGRLTDTGAPTLFRTWFQPDPDHGSVLAAAALLPYGTSVAHLVAGTTEPGGDISSMSTAAVPASATNALVATFNAGFRMADTPGAFVSNGRQSAPLENGLASATIDVNGQLDVIAWSSGPDLSGLTAVRQNLYLIVDGGIAVDGLTSNAGERWGSSQSQYQYTWRSGLGVTDSGDVVYVAGDQLTLQTLANALVQVGAVRGMELDIHPGKTAFSWWAPDTSGAVTPTSLLPAMATMSAPDRYLVADQRDFFYLTLPPSGD